MPAFSFSKEVDNVAKFECKQYPNLGFYYNGERKKFKTGTYVTNDQKEIEFLKSMNDVKVIEEEKPKKQANTGGKTQTQNKTTQTKTQTKTQTDANTSVE